MALILCVDDELDLLELLEEELCLAGHHVISATTGREALALIRERSPELVVCDVRMPDMDGFTLLETLRHNHPKLAWIPFVFLTGATRREDVLRGKALGADDYIAKPIDMGLLLATVEGRLVQSRRLVEDRDRDLVRLYSHLTGGVAPAGAAEADAKDRPLVLAACADHRHLDALQAAVTGLGLGFFGYASAQGLLEALKMHQPASVIVGYRTLGMMGSLLGRTIAEEHPKLRLIYIVPPEFGCLPELSHLEGFSAVLQFPCEASELARQVCVAAE